MADPTSPPTSPPVIEQPREMEVYRPLSGLAVAAFGLALLYALVLAVVALISLASRTPPFLPPWTLVVPAIAFFLAVGAGQHLRYAEGTRSGEALIVWARRLSYLGLVYLAVYVAIFLAVKMQAERFTRAWFDKIKKAETVSAFLDTRKPEERDSDDSEERVLQRYGSSGGGKGEYASFRESDIVQVLTSGNFEIQDQGVRELEYEQGGYRVELSYRIITAEGEYDWKVTARSSTTRKQREWMIVQSQTQMVDRRFTPLGESRAAVKDDALRFIMQSANKRSMGDVVGFYLDTLEPARRVEIGKVLHARMAGAISLEIGMAREGPLPFLVGQGAVMEAERGAVPGFDEFPKSSLAEAEAGPRATPNPQIVEAAAGFCRPQSDLRVRVGETGRLLLTVVNDTTFRAEKEVDVAILERGGPLTAGPKLTLEGRMIIEGVIPKGYQRPEWRLVKVGLIREKPAGPDNPRGRPPGMPPG